MLRAALFLLTAFLTIFALPIMAAGGEETLAASVMAIPPWGYVDPGTGLPAGLYSDLLDRLIREAGYTPKLAIRPYIRVAKDMKNGESRLTLMSDNDMIRNNAVEIAVLRSLDILVLGRPGGAATEVSQLQGKRIAALSGVEHHLLLKNVPGIRYEFVPTTGEQLKMLAAGRVDYVLGVREALVFSLRDSSFAGKVRAADGLLIGHWTARLWQSKVGYDAALSKRLAAALKALSSTGEIEAIFRPYEN